MTVNHRDLPSLRARNGHAVTDGLAVWPSTAPGAYQLHMPSDGVTIWYTGTPYEGQEIISIQHVKVDT